MNSFESGDLSACLDRLRDAATSLPKAYERWADVEEEIKHISSLHQTDWIVHIPDLHSETLVFLARGVRKADEEVFVLLINELTKRIRSIAARATKGFDKVATEQIVLRVEIQVLELVLTETPAVQSQFLEIVFATAVRRQTLKAVRRHEWSVQGRLDVFSTGLSDDREEEEIEGPIDCAPDDQPGPGAILAELQDKALRRHWLAIGYSAVKKSKHLHALILHHCVGMPISSNEGNPNLSAYFRARPGRVKLWIDTALAQLREAARETK